MNYPIPVLGICAYSGTGKTTLLTQLLPLLHAQGYKVGVIKHAHESFDIDHPGKDSHQLRDAGATKMLIASKRRMALIEEFENQDQEPTLEQTLSVMNPDRLDIVLVEGFKNAHFPKIELHRNALRKPLLFPNDSNIIAVVSDISDSDVEETSAASPLISRFSINKLDDITNFIIQFINDFSCPTENLTGSKFSVVNKGLLQ